MLRDLNGWDRGMMRVAITGVYKIKMDYGIRVIDFYSERELCVGNRYFEHKSLYKYNRVARG